ncbi:alpha/beta fold hydrolase [Nocardia stercoris]|uniref:Alpha/beta fold hydrolase n=1 Tax=Nocardia stercoris TaxID=2483361 RepID=A0A3M2L8S8_9NOCA|nr:alpha/beta fold hydrolase [Nocardia stercoris]RMI33967.1 alpha/beta fold hydrolase [Nocardia stercoris]
MMEVAPAEAFRSGRGEPILLLHGVMLNWQSWGAVLDDLARDHEVLAPTLPGHWGGPDAPEHVTIAALTDHLCALLDRNNWATAHLVGNSLGAWLSLELAARGRARSVTAIAPAGMWRPPSSAPTELIRRYRAYAPMLGVGSDGALASPMLRSVVTPLLCHDPSRVPARLAMAVTAAFAHSEVLGDLLGNDPAVAAGFDGLDDISVPVTVLRCEHDRVLPARTITVPPDTALLRTEILSGVGHVPMMEAPELVAGHIRDNIAKAAAGQAPA